MKLTYQTGVATLIQFITLSFLGIANGANSVVTTCRHDSTNCISNLIVSLIFFILTAAWFGIVWILGYTAQERRSRRLAQLLMCAEALIALIALFNAKHHIDALSLFTSLVDLILAVWIISLAFRLIRAGNTRVVAKQGRGRRRPPAAPLL
ncbi:MAG TPA: hypothetical protein VII55_00070 [Candidatus Saccharimonadales bacterium]